MYVCVLSSGAHMAVCCGVLASGRAGLRTYSATGAHIFMPAGVSDMTTVCKGSFMLLWGGGCLSLPACQAGLGAVGTQQSALILSRWPGLAWPSRWVSSMHVL